MWPFSILRNAREKASLRELFGQYITPTLLEELASKPVDPSLEKRTVLFALLHLRDDDPTTLAEHLRRAIGITVEATGTIDVMPPFLFVGFGFPLNDTVENLRSQRQRMVEKLLNECGRDIRIVTGETEGLVGTLGSERRFTYGAVIPRLSTAMQRLLALEFGTASEVVL